MTDIFEIFRYPLLSEVVLELRFPTRLKIPEYIAEFQDIIITEFPKLNEKYLTKFTLTAEDTHPVQTDKIWEFLNPETKTLCQVTKNKFSIISNEYKSWDKYESKKGFRDIIEFTLEKFLNTFSITNFDRIGLRYINKINIKENSSNWLKTLFIPIYNIEKYPIESLNEYFIRLRVERLSDIQLILQSTMITEDDSDYYILDFDAYTTNIEDKYLKDNINKLHEAVLHEFHSLITDECRKMMRGEKEIE